MLAEDGEAGAGAADRDTLIDAPLEGLGKRCVLPESDVIPLIAAGQEDGFRFVDVVDYCRVVGLVAGFQNEGRDGVDLAEFLDKGVVGGGAGGAKDQEVATV